MASNIYADCNPHYFAAWLARQRKRGLTIGFANGCFDLFHAGHIHLLKFARERCDRLIVAVNSDTSVYRLKGPGRPAEPAALRLSHVRSYADWALIFDQDNPFFVLSAVRPDFLFKGAGSNLTPGYHFCNWLVYCPFLPGFSTTKILEKS